MEDGSSQFLAPGMVDDVALRLIYIHGFQGDHRSFQAFPTDLHGYLRRRLPPHIPLQSCLYPTYKSRRHIAEAARKFQDWLATQPPGPVILLAHSMGGLLASEVVTADSEQSKRIIGLVAFDVPFLGMHPHVIISGIASLLPGDENNKEKTEAELNDETVVKRVRSDDVESIMSGVSSDDSINSESLHPSLSRSPSSFSLQVDNEWEAIKGALQPQRNRSQRNLTPYTVGPPSARSSSTSLVSSSTSMSKSILSHGDLTTSSLSVEFKRMTDKIQQRIHHSESDSRFSRWLRKHSDDPLRAMAKWVIESFQFGGAMFDPTGLRDRYQTLERWNGQWINIWTEVPGRGKAKPEADEGDLKAALPSNTADLPRLTGLDDQASEEPVMHGPAERKAAEKALRKQRTKERMLGAMFSRPPRHFIVLPGSRSAQRVNFHFGASEKWQKFSILNANDEVEAHCGLFIRSLNPHYELLVERVGNLVETWCAGLNVTSAQSPC